MRVQTEAPQFKADSKLLAFIEQKLSKLDQFFDRIIETNVVLKLENSGQVRDKIAEIRVHVPGDILIAKSNAKTFEASIDSATSTLTRQLKRYKDRLRQA